MNTKHEFDKALDSLYKNALQLQRIMNEIQARAELLRQRYKKAA